MGFGVTLAAAALEPSVRPRHPGRPSLPRGRAAVHILDGALRFHIIIAFSSAIVSPRHHCRRAPACFAPFAEQPPRSGALIVLWRGELLETKHGGGLHRSLLVYDFAVLPSADESSAARLRPRCCGPPTSRFPLLRSAAQRSEAACVFQRSLAAVMPGSPGFSRFCFKCPRRRCAPPARTMPRCFKAGQSPALSPGSCCQARAVNRFLTL